MCEVLRQVAVILLQLYLYFLGESCEEFEEGGRCPRATKYVPDSDGYESHGYESHGYPIPDIDTDLQGIFDHTEDLIQSVFK